MYILLYIIAHLCHISCQLRWYWKWWRDDGCWGEVLWE